jgi:hypothetical protein
MHRRDALLTLGQVGLGALTSVTANGNRMHCNAEVKPAVGESECEGGVGDPVSVQDEDTVTASREPATPFGVPSGRATRN